MTSELPFISPVPNLPPAVNYTQYVLVCEILLSFSQAVAGADIQVSSLQMSQTTDTSATLLRVPHGTSCPTNKTLLSVTP